MRKSHSTRRQSGRHVPGQKPRGCFQERVRKVGPEHFAIIPVDCGKPEARTRVADFYGTVLLEPFSFEISRTGLETACQSIGHALRKHRIQDCVCVLETTGCYHRPVAKAFGQESWDIRFVHPFTTCLIRRAADLGIKTDDVDLAAIHRAAMDGLAMQPEVLDLQTRHWRVLVRHRRDLVEKAATLKNQLKETIHGYLPGYTRLWRGESFWASPGPVAIATTFDSPQAMRDASTEQFREAAHKANTVIRNATVKRIRSWTLQAAPADDGYCMYHRRARSLWCDLQSKREEIRLIELDLGLFLCQSPCVLLLAFPGVNVVSASDYGAELGRLTNYPTSKSIGGRAGLYPARYQSSDIDYADGPLVARRNRALRAALMRLAHNLVQCNIHFMAQAESYHRRQPNYDRRVPVARAFSRLSYYLLLGGQLFAHSALQNQEKILQKLLEFFSERKASSDQVVTAMNDAIGQLPGRTLRVERSGLEAQHERVQSASRRTTGLVRLGEILPSVLLRINERLQKEDTNENHDVNNEDVTHGS